MLLAKQRTHLRDWPILIRLCVRALAADASPRGSIPSGGHRVLPIVRRRIARSAPCCTPLPCRTRPDWLGCAAACPALVLARHDTKAALWPPVPLSLCSLAAAMRTLPACSVTPRWSNARCTTCATKRSRCKYAHGDALTRTVHTQRPPADRPSLVAPPPHHRSGPWRRDFAERARNMRALERTVFPG